MATQSFFEDLIIDTPEAAANLTELIESGVKWKRGDSKYEILDAKDPRVHEMMERIINERNSNQS